MKNIILFFVILLLFAMYIYLMYRGEREYANSIVLLALTMLVTVKLEDIEKAIKKEKR